MHLKKPHLWERIKNTRFTRLKLISRLYKKRLIASAFIFSHIAGALTSIEAIMETRTPQGATAWAVALNLFPYITVPAYWAFGHTEMEGYVVARHSDLRKFQPVSLQLKNSLTENDLRTEVTQPMGKMLEALAGLSFTRGNSAELLIDGKDSFDSMFEAIDAAESYILIQFYIVRDDELGKKVRDKLIAKAKEGVKVYFLYDEMGSIGLPGSYVDSLIEAGVQITGFSTNTREGRKYQLNYRNHRKIVIVDGKVGFTGGLNIGDEYLDGHKTLTPWRDTHIRVTGPVVPLLQVSFGEDWYWATETVLDHLNWTAEKGPDGQDVSALCLATGPADPMESCAMFFLAAINSAEKRLWIATPYFVPDIQILSALQLAALRGVDVRILIPEKQDSKLVYFSSFSYLEDLEGTKIQTYRYTDGFMHQKVVLVDDDFASVGSANFDNRSFRLNFEITMAVKDEKFASEVATMLENDFSKSQLVTVKDLREKPFVFRLASRISRLLAPIQ